MAQYDIPITVFLKDLASDAMGKVGASAKKAQKIKDLSYSKKASKSSGPLLKSLESIVMRTTSS